MLVGRLRSSPGFAAILVGGLRELASLPLREPQAEGKDGPHLTVVTPRTTGLLADRCGFTQVRQHAGARSLEHMKDAAVFCHVQVRTRAALVSGLAAAGVHEIAAVPVVLVIEG